MTTLFDMEYLTLHDDMAMLEQNYTHVVADLDKQLQEKLIQYNVTLPTLFRRLAIRSDIDSAMYFLVCKKEAGRL